VNVQTPSLRAVQIVLALEAAWAIFLAYEIHHHTTGGFGGFGWQIQLVNFIAEWAAPAIGIVVVGWFVDMAVARLRA
jgi:hypothetical protein